MKKYDKVEIQLLFSSFLTYNFVSTVTSYSKFIMQITTRDAAKAYMKMVDNTQLGNSDEVRVLKRRPCIEIHYFNTPISAIFLMSINQKLS